MNNQIEAAAGFMGCNIRSPGSPRRSWPMLSVMRDVAFCIEAPAKWAYRAVV
ncbi:MAG: hypothetical protein OXS50_12240 [Gammaproteobacteria bacterium]|nr:hypothetical protein [Gammaproteobacteria bacterium]